LSVIISADERLKDSGTSDDIIKQGLIPKKKTSSRVKINPNFDKKIKYQLAKIKKKSDEDLSFKSHDCLLNRRFGQSKAKDATVGSTSKSLSEAMISEREYI
jgi:hypothetical protein